MRIGRGYKSTKTGNIKADGYLKRIEEGKGHGECYGITFGMDKNWFLFDTEVMITVTKHIEPNLKNKDNYYLVSVCGKNEYIDKLVKCTNLRGKKIFEAIKKSVELKDK